MNVPAQSVDLPITHRTGDVFIVFFSEPGPMTRARPQRHWKLIRGGEIRIEPDLVVLHGRRPKPFWRSSIVDIPIPRDRIADVVREGALVQAHVCEDGKTHVLKMWASSEEAATELVQALPATRTAQFEKRLAERREFNQALDAVSPQAVVTPVIVAANCLVFAATVVAGMGLFQPDAARLVQWGTNFGPLTLSGEWWRVFTAIFLHFGLIHLALNMWALWDIGCLTERLYGSAYFVLLYLFAGVSGSLASLWWHPMVNSAGASGAIFGVIGGLLAFMLNPKTRIPASIAVAHRNSAAVFIMYNLVNGLRPGIDNSAHVGGLIGGFAIGWILARPVDSEVRKDSGVRLITATLGSIAALGMLAWPAFHGNAAVELGLVTDASEQRFEAEFVNFAAAQAVQDSLDLLLAGQKLSNEQWGKRVQSDLLPMWQEAENEITASTPAENSQRAVLKGALIEYLDQKRLALDLMAEAMQKNDPDKTEWAQDVYNNNTMRAAEIKKLIKQAY